MSMSVEIKNLSALQHKLRTLPDSVTNVAIDEIQAVGVRIRDRARQNAPEESGELRRAIKKRREAKGLNAKVSVSGSGGRGKRFYARFVHWGSKAHRIVPTGRKKALAASAGDEAFGPVARVQDHPGTRANPFLTNAFVEETRDFAARLSHAIRLELARLRRR